MKIIIVETELYLAQSIATKLTQHRFEFEIHRSPKEAMDTEGDVYLLSTNAPNQTLHSFIAKHKNKIIILMVNYINNDTVGEPIKVGATDYILKPFRIEELFRKIEHYKEYQKLKQKSELFDRYLHAKFNLINDEVTEAITAKQTILITTNQLICDKLVFAFAEKNSMRIEFVNVTSLNLHSSHPQTLYYISGFDSLKKSEKETLLQEIKDVNFVLVSGGEIESSYNKLKIVSKNRLGQSNEILTIDEYIQDVITEFQGRYPDTELSKKLGMSRKSLWEKRKKYDLYKKK